MDLINLGLGFSGEGDNDCVNSIASLLFENHYKCLPCLELSTFKSLANDSLCDLFPENVTSDCEEEYVSDTGNYTLYNDTITLGIQDNYNLHNLDTCNLMKSLAEEETSSDEPENYEDKDDYEYDSDYDDNLALLNCGHPFLSLLE